MNCVNVNLNFECAHTGHRDEWLAAWTKLAQHCYANEPNTVTVRAGSC